MDTHLKLEVGIQRHRRLAILLGLPRCPCRYKRRTIHHITLENEGGMNDGVSEAQSASSKQPMPQRALGNESFSSMSDTVAKEIDSSLLNAHHSTYNNEGHFLSSEQVGAGVQDASHRSRKIILCFDGTGNKFGTVCS